MKKQNIIKLFLTSIMLSGCNFNFLNIQSSSSTGVNSSTNNSTVNGGYYNEVKDLLKDSYTNFTAHDGLSIKLKDTVFYYEQDTVYNNFDGSKDTFNGVVHITGLNANVKVDGLKEGNSILDMGVSTSFSGNFFMQSINDYSDYQNKDIIDEDLTSSVYIDDGKVYNNLCKLLHEATYDERYPNKFYQDMSSSFVELENEFNEETGLIFPLLSSTNIDSIKSMFEDVTFEDMVGMPEDKFDKIATYVLSDVMSLNKDGNNYVLSLNLTKDNISTKYLSLLDCLYQNELITDGNGNPVTLEDYNQIKEYEKESIDLISEYINHVMINVVFDSNFIKSISADIDVEVENSYTYDDENYGYEETTTTSLQTKVNLEFDYSDSIKADKPNYSEYVNIDEYFDPKNFVNEINKAANTSNPYSAGEVEYLYNYCVSEYDYDNETLTLYPEYNDYFDLVVDMNNNKAIERIVLEYDEVDEEYIVFNATYYPTTDYSTIEYDFYDLVYSVYGHTYEELVSVFGKEDYYQSHPDYEEYRWKFESENMTLIVHIYDGVVEYYDYEWEY